MNTASAGGQSGQRVAALVDAGAPLDPGALQRARALRRGQASWSASAYGTNARRACGGRKPVTVSRACSR